MKISDYPHCTCTPSQQDGDEPSCAHCWIDSARSAGIPDSVIEGRTKLSQHFSPEYVQSQCSTAAAEESAETPYEPDIDICSRCGEHAEFTKESGSNCCGASPYDTDPPDIDFD